PEKLEKPEKIEANEIIDTGEIPEDFAEDATIAVRPSPAESPRKRRERCANHGGNGVDRTTAGGRVPVPHPDGWEPTLRS
ncbi:MAG: hypothetical protein V3S64_17840, partial [bacterium]